MNEIQSKSNYKYLKYLAKAGSKDIHPKKEAATSFLMERLEINEGQQILEVGFGTGETLLRIASGFNVGLYGIDSMPQMYNLARKRLKLAGWEGKVNLSLIQKKSDFPYDDRTFDIIYAESVLGFQDTPDLFRLVKEIFRVLKPSGRFAVNDAVWKQGLTNEIVHKINAGCLKDFGMRQASEEYWIVHDWINLYQKYGFRLISADLIKHLNGNEFQHRSNGSDKNNDSVSKYLKSFVNPFLIKDIIGYRKKLRAHKQDGQYIEPWIIILQKV